MKKRILVSCECEGTGWVAVADNRGEGVEHVECGQHHPAYQDAPSVDELLAHKTKLALAASSLSLLGMTSLRASSPIASKHRIANVGVKLGAGGYQSQAAAEYAGKQALERFLQDLANEDRRK